MHSFIGICRLILLFIWMIVLVIIAFLLMLITFSRKIAFAIERKIWAPTTVKWGGGRLTINGQDNVDFSKNYVFMSNHLSAMDIPAIVAAVKTNLYFVAKKELRKIPFLGWMMVAFGMIFIDRSNSRKAIASLKNAGKLIKEKKSILTFPEGTRSTDLKLGPFKKGSFYLAIEAGIPIVPIAIKGTNKVWPTNNILQRGDITVLIGKPISTENLTTKDINSLRDKVKEEVQSMINKL